jgi:hypothetical protein
LTSLCSDSLDDEKRVTISKIDWDVFDETSEVVKGHTPSLIIAADVVRRRGRRRKRR